MKKEFIKLSAILCIITLIASLLLAGVNKITAPRIAAAEERATNEAMQKIIPEADDFQKLDDFVNVALKDGKKVGYCVKTSTSGFGGEISMMVGFDAEMKVQGIEILGHSETAGLGAKITEDSFKKQFKNKNSVLEVVKVKTDKPGEITAITGATISSRAITDGIKKAVALVEAAEKGANK